MEPGKGRVVRRRLGVRHPDVVVVHVEVGGVGGGGDLGDVGGRGLSDVVPVHPSEERMTPEVQDSILSHPDLGGTDQSPHEVLGAVRGLHVGGEVEAGLGRDSYRWVEPGECE